MSFIYLFRCKAERNPQGDAFATEMNSSDVLKKSFLARPTAKVPRGSVWHIGNTTIIDDGAIFFALGREAIVTAQHFDDNRREFIEIEQSQAPFTVGVFDPNLQVAGIFVKPGVSLVAREVSAKLEILLEEAGVAASANRHILVDFIPDPTGFITILQNSLKITRFEFEFTTPNPPDDNKYIQRPLKKFAEMVGASEGKASVRGASLERDVLIELSKDIAATGDNATANVQMEKGGEIERRSLRVNALKEPVQTTVGEDAGNTILRAIRNGFNSLRAPSE